MSALPPVCGTSLSFQLLVSQISIPTRDPSGPFLMSVDHCFSIKGQGTVMTGTILSGSVSLGDSVEIPALKVSLASPPLPLGPSRAARRRPAPVRPRCRATLPRLPSVRPACGLAQRLLRCSDQHRRLEPRGRGFSVKAGGPRGHLGQQHGP